MPPLQRVLLPLLPQLREHRCGARGGVPQPGDVEAMPAAPAFGGPSRAE